MRIGRWFPELVDPAARALTWPQIAAHHQWISDQLKAPVTVATIAQRLRDDHGVEVSESTVRRYIATTFAEDRLEEKVTVPRGAVEPGSEAQIDYGKRGMWCDPASGRRVAVWVFAMILSCSRALFVLPVLKMDQTSWNASHVAAFEFFGVPARLVCDNLKTGVVRPDLYDPQINLAYGELAAFYGTLIDPARANKRGTTDTSNRSTTAYERSASTATTGTPCSTPAWSSATSRPSTTIATAIRPWATGRRLSTLRHAGAPTPRWPARSTESGTKKTRL